MTALYDTRHCPMCEDAAKKILELEQRVKVLTETMQNIRRVNDSGDMDSFKLEAMLIQALNQTPQQTADQIERWHVEWMMKLPVAHEVTAYSQLALGLECTVSTKLVAIPQLPDSKPSPETALDEAQRRQ